MALPALGPMAAPIIGGAVEALGGLASNAQNAALTKKSFRWQRKMSNTQFQRGMRDMERAGLNPILAYQKGGASYGSPSTIAMQNVTKGATQAGTAAASLKLQNAQTAAQVANLDAQTALGVERINTEKANQAQSSSAAALNMANARTAEEMRVKAHWEGQRALSEANISLYNVSGALRDQAIARIERKFAESPIGEAVIWLRQFRGMPGTAAAKAIIKRGK